MPIIALYNSLKSKANQNLLSKEVTEGIVQITIIALGHLRGFIKKPIVSSIVGKRYFVFQSGAKISRPINEDLFLDVISDEYYQLFIEMDVVQIPLADAQKVLYTLGMAYCAARDIAGTQDKKSPSIFFEIFIGNIFSRVYNSLPKSQVLVDLDEFKTTLPTDYIFHPEGKHIKIHLPIKLSTRERSIQAWAHQRVLEGMYGVGRYKGVMVVLAETNYVAKNNSVVEVCLPDQWRLYQLYISKMTRIYYLDIPKKYEELVLKFPYIEVKPFYEFFIEKDLLVTIL
jgi:hypothetical protein